MHRIRQLAENSGAKIVFFAPEASTLNTSAPAARKTLVQHRVRRAFDRWDDLPSLEHDLRNDDCLWFVMSRRDRVSYHPR